MGEGRDFDLRRQTDKAVAVSGKSFSWTVPRSHKLLYLSKKNISEIVIYHWV